MSTYPSSTPVRPPSARLVDAIMRWQGVAVQLGIGVFPFAATGLLAPGWAVAIVALLWIASAVMTPCASNQPTARSMSSSSVSGIRPHSPAIRRSPNQRPKPYRAKAPITDPRVAAMMAATIDIEPRDASKPTNPAVQPTIPVNCSVPVMCVPVYPIPGVRPLPGK